MPLEMRNAFRVAMDLRVLVDLAEATGLLKLPDKATLARAELDGPHTVIATIHCDADPRVLFGHPGIPEAPLYLRYHLLLMLARAKNLHVDAQPPAVRALEKQVTDAHALFHGLWTKAVGAPDYDKKLWVELEAALFSSTTQPTPPQMETPPCPLQ